MKLHSCFNDNLNSKLMVIPKKPREKRCFEEHILNRDNNLTNTLYSSNFQKYLIHSKVMSYNSYKNRWHGSKYSLI